MGRISLANAMKRNSSYYGKAQYRFCWYFINGVKQLRPVLVIGAEHFLSVENRRVFANHTSHFDYPIICSSTRDRFVVPFKIKHYDWFPIFFDFGGGLWIDPDNVDRPYAVQMARVLRSLPSDVTFMLFPEGERNKGDATEIGEINPAMHMYTTGGDYLVIVYVAGARGWLNPFTPSPVVYIREPIPMSQVPGKAEFGEWLQAEMQQGLNFAHQVFINR